MIKLVNFTGEGLLVIRREQDELKEQHLALKEELKTTHEQFVEQCKIAEDLQEEKKLFAKRMMSQQRAQLKAKVSVSLFLATATTNLSRHKRKC